MMLKFLFAKHRGKPDPRYINIDGHKWDSKNPLEYVRTPGAMVGVGASAVMAFNSAVSGQFVTAMTYAAIGCAMTGMGLTLGYTLTRHLRNSALSHYAIDREGRTPSPENAAHLHMMVNDYKFISRLWTCLNGGVSLMLAVPDVILGSAGNAPAFGSIFGLAYAAHYAHGWYISEKLIRGDYTFCSKPPAKEVKKAVAVPSAFAPRPTLS